MTPTATSPLPREHQLVLALCRTPLSETERRRAEGVLAGSLDWPAALAFAARSMVEPVALANLLQISAAPIPAVVLEEIKLRHASVRARAWSRTTILLEIVARMRGADVGAIVLKGPAVSLVAYGDVTLRSFGDLDLLVRPSDVSRAAKVLISMGLAPQFTSREARELVRGQHALEFRDTRTLVELHTSLFPRYLRLEFEPTEIWKNSHSLACLDSAIDVLAPAQLFVYLSAHGARHQWEALRWICDLAQLESRLGDDAVQQVVDLASATRSRRLVALALRVVRDAFGSEGARMDADTLATRASTERLLERARSAWGGAGLLPVRSALSLVHPSLEPFRYWLSARERLWDRIASTADLFLSPSVRDTSAGSLRLLWRPFRLGAAMLRRASWAR